MGTLPFSCLLGFLLGLIAAGGWLRFLHCWSAGGTRDVVLMVLPARGGFFGEHFWGMVGVIRCLWQVSPTSLEQACWGCLVVSVLFRLGDPWQCLPWVGMSCICSGRIVCGLWPPSFCGRPLVGFGRCVASVMPIWCGLVFSLCGCEMISGLLPRIYTQNFVNCVSLKCLCTLSI